MILVTMLGEASRTKINTKLPVNKRTNKMICKAHLMALYIDLRPLSLQYTVMHTGSTHIAHNCLKHIKSYNIYYRTRFYAKFAWYWIDIELRSRFDFIQVDVALCRRMKAGQYSLSFLSLLAHRVNVKCTKKRTENNLIYSMYPVAQLST